MNLCTSFRHLGEGAEFSIFYGLNCPRPQKVDYVKLEPEELPDGSVLNTLNCKTGLVFSCAASQTVHQDDGWFYWY